MTSPTYDHARVQSIRSLEHPLGADGQRLQRIAMVASRMYYVAKRLPKDDGTERVVYDTRPPLKQILKRINSSFLRRVTYPDYLTGGVPGKDYKSSADLHANAATVIKEDISKFYPSVSAEVVFDIWRNFFRFSEEVSEILTQLTTRDGHLEQGAPTSGYLANLALWDVEERLVKMLKSKHKVMAYSRHVDDVCISSDQQLTADEVGKIVSLVYGTLMRKGLKPNRSKHKVMKGHGPIKILKLVANTKASLPRSEQSRVRAIVHGFCQRFDSGADRAALLVELPSVRGQAYKLKRFHSRKALPLIARIDAIALILAGAQGSI